MTMRYIRVLALATIGLLVPGFCNAAEPAWLSRKPTWVETVIASRENIARQDAEAQERLDRQKNADVAIKAFVAFKLDLTSEDKPQPIKVRVAGLKHIYFGSAGRCESFVANPQLIDAQGNAKALDLTKARALAGTTRNSAQASWVPIKHGANTFAAGVLARDGEWVIDLDGQAIWLQAQVCAVHREKRETRVWIDCQSAAEQQTKSVAARDVFWQTIMAAFPQSSFIREMRIEELAGIWRATVKVDGYAELASRYAAACAAPQREAAKKLAASCKSIGDLQNVRDLFYIQHVQPRLDLAGKTLEFVQRSAARPELATQLDALTRQLDSARKSGANGEALYVAACELRRQIILSHPLLDFDRLLINKRSGELPEHMCDQYLGRHSKAAPGLVVLSSWKTNPTETLLLQGKLPIGGVLHPDLSYDGRRVLFAFADHHDPKLDHRLRGYRIYELSIESGQVRQITGTADDLMVGQKDRETVFVEDMDPCYLPDGGMAFISTRSQQFGRCHGGRYVPSYTLYRGQLDGSGIYPLSYNESNEWGPSVLPDGSLVYTRWDYVNRHDTIFQSLWTIRPDGTQTAHYYGNNSRSPCLIGEAQTIPHSQKVVSTAAPHHGQTLGTLITVDPYKGQEDGEPLTWLTPELVFPEASVPKGITRTPQPLAEDCPAGRARAATPWPISEDLFLCTYQHGGQFAVYLIDTLGGRELIYQDASIGCFDPIPLRPRPAPPVLPSAIVHNQPQKTGTFYVQDVYQCNQPIPRGTIKRMRINEIISQPTSSFPTRSYAENEIVKKILGTVPVNDDGSVAFEAPADTPMQFQLLDENGMAVMTMRSLVYLQPGEKASCVGCHESRYAAPPTAQSMAKRIDPITPPAGPQYVGGFSFARTVQPVLDRYCISCHGLEKTEAGIDLTGAFRPGSPLGKDRLAGFSVAYESLIANGKVTVARRNAESATSKPNDYFANAGKLACFLLDGHPDKQQVKRIAMDRDSLQRIFDWLDVNAQFYGDYSFNRIENQPALAAGEKALRQSIERRFGVDLARQPYAALVNVANPAESRILMSPLPASAGGWGQIAAGAYASTTDPAFVDMRKLVDASITPLKYHDIAGTCGRDDRCVCGVCWVRKNRAQAVPASAGLVR